MGPLVDRKEFRTVLKEVVKCVRTNLDGPGLTPLNAEQVVFWLGNIHLEDVQVVLKEIEEEKKLKDT